MCNLSQGVKERAMEQGMTKGVAKGREDAMLQAIKSVMDSLKLSSDAAMDVLKVPSADRAKYRAMLQS